MSDRIINVANGSHLTTCAVRIEPDSPSITDNFDFPIYKPGTDQYQSRQPNTKCIKSLTGSPSLNKRDNRLCQLEWWVSANSYTW